MKLLLDMNLSAVWVPFLRAEGFEAEHWSELGAITAKDSTLMAHARESGAVILTHDLGFGTLLALSGASLPSVLLLRAGHLGIEVLGARVVAALRQNQAALVDGAMLVLDERRHKLRLLPIARPA